MDDLDELCIEVSSVVNPYYFNQVSDEDFRSKVVEIMREIIKRSEQQQEMIKKIDSKVISQVFFDFPDQSHSGIDWKILANNYDENRRRFSGRSSPLEILFDILKDPVVVPIALTETIVLGLLNVCVDISPPSCNSTTYTRLSSLKHFKNHILLLLCRRPICLVSDVFGKFIRNHKKKMIDCSTNESIDVGLQLGLKAWLLIRDLSSTTQVMDGRNIINVTNLFPSYLILEHIIEFIRYVDDHLIYVSNHLNHRCRKCSQKRDSNKERKPKRVKTASINFIHDELSDCDDSRKELCSKYHRNQPQTSIESVCLKSILAISFQCCNHKQVTSWSISTHSAGFLSFLCALFVDTLQKASQSSIRWEVLERKYIYLAFKFPTSPSVRLCIILTSSLNPRRSFLRILQILIGDISGCRETMISDGTLLSRVIPCLNMYLEIVCNCCVFDNTSLCRKATILLIELTLSFDAESSRTEVLLLLRCIAWLLCGRAQTLLHDDLKESKLIFNHSALRLAFHYGTHGYWFDESMDDQERKQIFIGLQSIGILSFADESLTYDYWTKMQIYLCSCVRPYSYANSIQAAVSRSGLQMESLFVTKPCKHVVIPATSVSTCHLKRERDDHLFAEPLMDYLNEDLISNVLSFLGYKKLVHVSTVCKLIYGLANQSSIWKDHYSRRYNPTFIEDYLPTCITKTERKDFIDKFSQKSDLNWKQLFREKWMKERIESKRRSGRTKHKCCTLVGCLTILKKSQDHNRHKQVHLKFCLKKLEAIRRTKKE